MSVAWLSSLMQLRTREGAERAVKGASGFVNAARRYQAEALTLLYAILRLIATFFFFLDPSRVPTRRLTLGGNVAISQGL